ncbi:MAG: bifunctional hydroxymethylpyrimidine kinase/phosphomethylpyrimidine kinase [Spirochaetaceae bacterium]
MRNPPVVLTIAGSDSGGGAGIQADLKTCTAFGVYGASVVTSVTAQNTRGVQAVYPMEPEAVNAQLDSVLSDIEVDVIKIGMLHNAEIIHRVETAIAPLGVPLILDPVMVATSGDLLLEPPAVTALRERLFPLATLITPNIHEAGHLTGVTIRDSRQLEAAARQLLREGPEWVLIKGGDTVTGEGAFARESSDDLLVGPVRGGETESYLFSQQRIDTENAHGTGCTLASAIAAALARGNSIPEAVRAAKEYVTHALESGREWRIGGGRGPVNHFYAIHEEATV